MRKIYTLLIIALLSASIKAQSNYEFGIINVAGNNFKIVAVPNFTSSGNTNISDVGFTLSLPTGSSDIVSLVSLLGSGWSVVKFDGSVLLSAGIGDGTLDLYNIKRDPGSIILAHTVMQQIDLVSFDITNAPASGTMSFLSNSDPIALHAAFGGGLNSFYNSDIDNTGVGDYFNGYVSGMESFVFSTLSTNDVVLEKTAINVFPNPAKDILNISTKGNPITYSLFNILGQSVKINGTIGNSEIKTINISNLPNGIYLLKTKDENNNQKSFKILKNK